jgi:hypothetical protein
VKEALRPPVRQTTPVSERPDRPDRRPDRRGASAGPGRTWRHVQPPRSVGIVLIRGGLALLVLLGVLYVTQWRQRISASSLQRQVAAKLHAPPARCADRSGNGSTWNCRVGSPPASRCVVVDVTFTGAWSLRRHAQGCRYP